LAKSVVDKDINVKPVSVYLTIPEGKITNAIKDSGSNIHIRNKLTDL
jgi:hypothetical protein